MLDLSIEGVVIRQLKMIPDERGFLMEILRRDWDVFDRFGQVYVTAVYPNVVKAWHMHHNQTDHLVCIKGMVKLALWDGVESSKTYGEIIELFVGEKNPTLVKVPAKVWHGFKGIGSETALVINVPTALYNYKKPDEHRLPPDTDKIPYDWLLQSGLKHG